MKKSEWWGAVRKSCKQKMANQDSSVFCVYCRRKDRNGGNLCEFKNCPLANL